MTKPSDADEYDAVALLRPLAGDPAGPARIDVSRAMAEGRLRRRTRWWAAGTAIVALTATTAAGGTLAVAALDRKAPAPRPIASPPPSSSAAAAPDRPRDCTVTRLPTDGIRKAVVTGGDPSGHWLVGRTYPPGGGESLPVVVWKDGKLVDKIMLDGRTQAMRDINSRGDAVGASYLGFAMPRPYAYSAGKTVRLAGGFGSAQAINDAGVVVGSLQSGNDKRPVRWSSVTARPENLPLPAGSGTGVAVDVDEEGNVLGAVDIGDTRGVSYLWLADGSTRRMPLPEMDGHRVDAIFAESIRNGWVVGRGRLAATGDTGSYVSFRYRIATDRYEQLRVESGRPIRVAANGWVLGVTDVPVITNAAGATTVLPKYPKAKGRQDYLVSSFSDDGLVVAGYAVGTDIQNQPLLWRCR